MTQSLTTSGRGVALASLVVPVLSPALDWRVERVWRGVDAVEIALPAIMQQEAVVAARAMDALLAPSRLVHVQAWMEAVALSVGNPPDERGRLARIALVFETSGDLPVGCWTRETRAAFSRHRGVDGRWWPSDGEVDAFVRPLAAKLRRTARGLRTLLAPQEQPHDIPPSRSPMERERVEEAVRATLAAITEGGRHRDAVFRPVTPVEDIPVAAAQRQARSGRDLWEARNRARRATGLPQLPEPESFEGYGRLASEAGREA